MKDKQGKGLVAVCTNPNGEGVWWQADSTDEPCVNTFGGDGFDCCKPAFYLPASLYEELADHLSNCLAIIDGEQRVGPDNEAQSFLSEFRAAHRKGDSDA